MANDALACRIYEAAYCATPLERVNGLVRDTLEMTRTLICQRGVERALNYVKRLVKVGYMPKYIRAFDDGRIDAWYLYALTGASAGDSAALEVMRRLPVHDNIRRGITSICEARYSTNKDEKILHLIDAGREFSYWLAHDYYPLAAVGRGDELYDAYSFVKDFLDALRRAYEQAAGVEVALDIMSSMEA